MGDGRIVIVGCDALALCVCAELAGSAGRPVVVLWSEEDDLEARVARCGGTFVKRTGDERESLLAAGILQASVVVAITENDHLNLQFGLQARDENPSIRIVLRQFNRTLGRKIEENLPNSAAISLSSYAAATYAGAAMDRTCYHAIQFPDIDGPLAGFFEGTAAETGVAGLAARDVLARNGRRLLAVGDDANFAPDRVLAKSDRVTLFGHVQPRRATSVAAGAVPRARARAFARAVRRLDPIARGAIAFAAVMFVLGSAFFAHALRLDPLTAAYFALTTMTTTGYGDISPRDGGPFAMLAAMSLMLGGLIFGGVLIAMLSAIFTQARYDAVQGLRRISSSGHVIVCGAGNVGSRVLEFLERLGCKVVVVEQNPRPEIVEGSRDRRYELLTGDAARDATLDLCNVEQCIAVVALTNSDTMNLEVALGARARNATLPVVMRVQHETFERSVRSHFGFRLTFGTATLAAPAIAGLAVSEGARGHVGVGAASFALMEMVCAANASRPAASEAVPLACWRAKGLQLLERFEDARPGERVLFVAPLERRTNPVRASNERVI